MLCCQNSSSGALWPSLPGPRNSFAWTLTSKCHYPLCLSISWPEIRPLLNSPTGCGAVICPSEQEGSWSLSFDKECLGVLPPLSRQRNVHMCYYWFFIGWVLPGRGQGLTLGCEVPCKEGDGDPEIQHNDPVYPISILDHWAPNWFPWVFFNHQSATGKTWKYQGTCLIQQKFTLLIE